MSRKEQLIQEVKENRIIAILRGIEADKCADTAEALLAGGIGLVEVTFNQKESGRGYHSTVEGIRDIVQRLGGKMRVGAGTVLTLEQLRLAYDAGAEYIITPNVDTDVIKEAGRLGLVTMPGAFTPTEVCQAYGAGADFVKIFPASAVGPDYFRALKGPLGHIPLMAVGGVDEENAKAFLDAGAAGLGIGGNLVDRRLVSEGRFDEMTAIVKGYVERICQGGKILVH